MEKEIWKDTEYEGYMVSSLGRVKHVLKKGTYRILTNSNHRCGYKTAYCGQKNRLVHRLVAKAFIPNPENKKDVNHIDGDKTNNNVNNLEWTTRLENMQHAKNVLQKDWCMIRKKVQLRTSHENKIFDSIADLERYLFGKRTKTIEYQLRTKGFYQKDDKVVCFF